jgi:hypothetical protein
MDTLSFRQLPLVVKVAVWLVFNNAWWSMEEFVINRYGLGKYMPYYKMESGCLWDLGVALVVGFAVWRLSRPDVRQAA